MPNMSAIYYHRLELLFISLFTLTLVPPNFCGNRIVNGVPKSLEDFPFQVMIQFYRRRRERSDRDPFCGGTILERNWIMTAGHCFNEDVPDRIGIIAGAEDPDMRTGRPIKPEKYFKHPQLISNNNFSFNDIALIKLKQPLTFGPKVNKTTLPDEDIDDFKGAVYVTGWGLTKEGGENGSQVLMGVKIKIQQPPECQKRYGNAFDPKTMICAGLKSGQKDSCKGDSGGPLTKFLKVNPLTSKKIVIGIVSWGFGCGRPNTHAIYTKVLAYKKWIEETISNN